MASYSLGIAGGQTVVKMSTDFEGGSLLHEPVGFGVSLERWNCS